MSRSAEAVAEALATVIDAPVAKVTRLSAGASRQTWAFSAGSRPCILQLGHAGAALPMTTEAALVRAARTAGAPAPEVIGAGNGGDDDPFDAPWMITERLDGETIPRKILRDERYAHARVALTDQCGAALARIHALDGDRVDRLPDDDQLDFWDGVYRQLDDPHAVFEVALRWLHRHRPPEDRSVVVHGDFRTGNLLVDEQGLRGVLDWELAHRGDRHEDLAWLCVRAWRFGQDAPVGGFGHRGQLVEAYRRAGGHPVDGERLRWWEVFGTLRWGVICLLQVHAHLAGAPSLEQAAIGRRVAETEYDLALLLPGGDTLTGSTAPAPAPSTDRGRHDRPTIAELLEAVRQWVSTDVAEATTGRTRHLTRVADNVLATIERELALADHTRQASAAVSDLAADEVALAQRIAAGRFDDRLPEIAEALFPLVLAKLSVANPRYVERRHAGASMGPHQ